jgi:hypothetical protein
MGGHMATSQRKKEVRGSNPLASKSGCHVAALDWATWHPSIRPERCHVSQYNSTQLSTNQNLPRHAVRSSQCCVSLPRQPATQDADVTLVPRVTHPVVTRVTSRLVKLHAKKSKMHDTWHHLELPRVLYGHATSLYGLPRQLYGLPRQLYGLPSQHQIFACLARRTDLDNFSIRTPFAKINIPPESGERDGRNGTVFVAFRAL